MSIDWLNRRRSSKSSLAIVSGVFLLGLLISTIIALTLYKTERNLLEYAFASEVEERNNSLSKEFDINFEAIFSLSILFSQYRQPDFFQFQNEAKNILSRRGALSQIVWLPNLDDRNRKVLEENQRVYFPGYEITERGLSEELIRAAQRNTYFPAMFAESRFSQNSLLGFDFYSINQLRVLIDESVTSALPTAMVVNSNLLSYDVSQQLLITFLPIYEGQPKTSEARMNNLKGVISGIFTLKDLFVASGMLASERFINMRILDQTNQSEITEMMTSVRGDATEHNDLLTVKPLNNVWQRNWVVEAVPTKQFVKQQLTWLPYAVFITGLVITFSICVYLNIVFKRASFVRNVVRAKTRELAEANRRLAQLNHTDGLTGVANRRCFDARMEKVWQRAKRHSSVVSLVFIDIDNFKEYNDYYGHLAGDECLKKVATALSTIVNRSEDLLARYGGEEFVVLMPETDNAQVVAERCIKVIRNLQISHKASDCAREVTISAGCASTIVDQNSLQSCLIEAADVALYKAKEMGKNCYVDASVVSKLHHENVENGD
ncbi:MAG: diguanylate cyclase [Alteromonadaceae bacterium]|nr:diguanylate cyclase [Alteromonadaceae bacterium]